MTRLPSKVKILNHTWTIVEESLEPEDGSDYPNYGKCERFDQVITINKDMTVDNKRVTLLHELLHACRYSNGNPGLLPDFTDVSKEEIILTWEHMLLGLYEEPFLSILRNNPKVVEYLVSND